MMNSNAILTRKKEEKVATENHGEARCVKSCIERKMLRSRHISIAHCHGGGMEGNSMRRLMRNGGMTFIETSTHLTGMRDENEIGNSNGKIANDEIELTHKDCGCVFCIEWKTWVFC